MRESKGDIDGNKFLVGYRKFTVALIWTLLMGFIVVWSIVIIKPSAGQSTIVVWMIASCGFFCAFFVGGNALAWLWASKYAPPQTTANLTQETKDKSIEVVYKYSAQEDAAFSKAFEGEENDLPKPKPR